jgi:hypothetical protein
MKCRYSATISEWCEKIATLKKVRQYTIRLVSARLSGIVSVVEVACYLQWVRGSQIRHQSIISRSINCTESNHNMIDEETTS